MITFNLHLVAHTLALKLPQAGVRGMNERLHIAEQMGNVNSTPHANVSPEMEKSPNDMAPAQNYLKSAAEHFSNDPLMGGDRKRVYILQRVELSWALSHRSTDGIFGFSARRMFLGGINGQSMEAARGNI